MRSERADPCCSASSVVAMSELSKLLKHLQEVSVQLEEFSVVESPDRRQDESVLAVAAQLVEGGTRDRCEAFRRKLADKDPVSQSGTGE